MWLRLSTACVQINYVFSLCQSPAAQQEEKLSIGLVFREEADRSEAGRGLLAPKPEFFGNFRPLAFDGVGFGRPDIDETGDPLG